MLCGTDGLWAQGQAFENDLHLSSQLYSSSQQRLLSRSTLLRFFRSSLDHFRGMFLAEEKLAAPRQNLFICRWFTTRPALYCNFTASSIHFHCIHNRKKTSLRHLSHGHSCPGIFCAIIISQKGAFSS